MTRPSEEQIQREEAARRAYWEKRELVEIPHETYAVMDEWRCIIGVFDKRNAAEHFLKVTPWAHSIEEPPKYRYVLQEE
jgi:hypothetical protein